MKSHESDLVELAECIYRDASAKCATVIDARDLRTIRSRVKHEGLSFLTITLPTFGQDFERCLDEGRLVSGFFNSFKKRLKTPAFLQGFFTRVFDSQTGGILHEPDIACIEAVRQIAFSFKKLSVTCSEARVRKAIVEFKQCERDLEELVIGNSSSDALRSVSHVIWGSIFGRYDIASDGYPKHGPGATCERISGNAKFSHKRWHDRLEPYFPLLESAYSVSAAFSSELEQVSIVDEADESPVRVITVPKTLKAPRIIAIEPVCMQYTQQQLKSILVREIEKSWMTAGHVNFTDQGVNRSMALTSSSSGHYATLDLSSASDRVRNDLASIMFDFNPDLLGAIQACRSKMAILPGGDKLQLVKFASMGSALCFPVESMFFYTICVMALLKKRKLPVNSLNAHKVSREVYVYGDDLIVPVNDVAAVIDHLHTFGCKVNAAKSFWTGKFRESCGMDAYDGEEVTPTYVRHMLPGNRRDTKALISLVETSNLFYKRGYWLTSNHIVKRCEAILGTLPVIGEQCSGLGKVSFCEGVYTGRFRWNPTIQVNEVLTWVPRPVYRKDRLEGYAALQKCLIQLESRPPGATPVAEDHLLRSARYGAVVLKRHWVRPY